MNLPEEHLLQLEKARREHRVKALHITPEWLATFPHCLAPGREAITSVSNLPALFTVVRTGYLLERDVFVILLCSPEFESVERGTIPPTIDLEFTLEYTREVVR